MHMTECVTLKIVQPTQRKARWLSVMADMYSQAVQLGLDAAESERTSSRNKIHKAMYYASRQQFGLPSDYARMAVAASVSLARSYYGLRAKQRRTSFPKVNGSQGLGLGVNAYALHKDGERWSLRVSTGTRGQYIWLPLHVPAKFVARLALAKGDARLFARGSDWYVSLPIRVTPAPTACSGEPTFIGVDLGIVRHAVVSTPDRCFFFSGKAARHKREHLANLRSRYGHHRRMDRVKASKGRESAWVKDANHKLSASIVEIALQYPNPVIVLEKLDGIRNRVRGSKRFNRMISSWPFRQLADFIEYKAARYGIPVLYIDPRGTSKTCPKCGHSTRSNRPDQGHFRCVACGYAANADLVAARNIAAAGACLWQQGPSDLARPNGQTENGESTLSSSRPDVASVDAALVCQQTTTSSSS